MQLRSALSFLSLAALAPLAAAQSFSYQDFSSTAGLKLNGQAAPVGNVLRVNPATPTGTGLNRGSVWYTNPVNVSTGFDTTFQFQINGLVGVGADGMAFVIQNDTNPGTNGQSGTNSIGRDGGACGYGLGTFGAGESVENSLAIELDAYQNASPDLDPDGNHISIHTNGTGDNSQNENFSIGIATSAQIGIDFSGDLATHTLRVLYVPGTLQVFLDGNLELTTPYDFATGGTFVNSGNHVNGLNLIGGTQAYVGFTGACGGIYENHDVLSWDWTSTQGYLPICDPGQGGVIACPCSNPPAGSGRGCDNSAATGGASIQASGDAQLAADTLVFTTADQRPNGTTVLLQGTQNNGTGAGFGQGVRCASGQLKRLYLKSASGGSITAPGPGDPSVSARAAALGDVILTGQHRYYMVYYRDPIVLGGCSALFTYNASNALDVVWN